MSEQLTAYTPARVALARTGVSLTTRDALHLALAHAQARDAVYASLSLPTLLSELHARHLPTLTLQSAAPDRATYIRRPDLGRTLSPVSRTQLAAHAPAEPITGATSRAADGASNAPRLTIILADGLSALATDRHALPLLDALLPLLRPGLAVDNEASSVENAADFLTPLALSNKLPAAPPFENPAAWQLTPIVLAEQARVALGDEIGLALGASLTLMLVGERPGLSAADSLGAYLTWAPAPGRTDAQRNCVSNIRGGGLDPATAARRIALYLHEAHRLALTGTALKDPGAAAPELLVLPKVPSSG